ncbi:Thymidylate kinase [Pseudobutyrivibrio sp. UC1225]|uniref:ATP-binding protein n=1 Tax=Pseudobutyrivibrio sp. UC1225 TaxID=1798185 RepID=UPI0008E47F32|nr:ATP-binding protein [Pseudobutyrivibrio sp. UC1225]SFO28739.1 Thymidylate kinase [Pseudobutyrivibrio sp. UC1225]
MKTIFIAGPHGSGKTTLISEMVKQSTKYIKDDFSIDFTNEMDTLPEMTIFEKCLIRLYHRFYTAERAIKKSSDKNDERVLIVDRSLYDSLVYVEVEYKLGELNDWQYNKLKDIILTGLEMIKPYTVILNPDAEEVVNRLEDRRKKGTRKKRDVLCAREDNTTYIGMMNDEFEKLSANDKVLQIRNNGPDDIKMIEEWLGQAI